MKKLLVLLSTLLLFLFSMVPTGCDAASFITTLKKDHPYIAGYTNVNPELFQLLKLDYLQKAYSWDGFDAFLAKVKDEAGDRPVILELDVHGLDKKGLNVLWIESSIQKEYGGRVISFQRSYGANMGFIVRHIEKHFPLGQVQCVLLEACYAESCYQSIRSDSFGVTPGLRSNDVKFEDCNHVPQFPIYGVDTNSRSYSGFVFFQYITDTKLHFEDLRKIEDVPPKKLTEKEEQKVLNTLETEFRYFLILLK